MKWKKWANSTFMFTAITYISLAGYGAAREGDIDIAMFTVCCLLFILISIGGKRQIKKLENTILEQESVLLRTQYIRNRMLEEKNG